MKSTTATEIRHFLALYFLTGIVKKTANSTVLEYRSTSSDFSFQSSYDQKQFQKIFQFIHFADDSNYYATDPGREKLFKVRDIVEILVDRFKTVYIATENISVDEQLLRYEGRLSFKQYIPTKRARFGINLFSLCEDSAHLWISFVYLGKTTINENQHQLERGFDKSGVMYVCINLFKVCQIYVCVNKKHLALQ